MLQIQSGSGTQIITICNPTLAMTDQYGYLSVTHYVQLYSLSFLKFQQLFKLLRYRFTRLLGINLTPNASLYFTIWRLFFVNLICNFEHINAGEISCFVC